MRYSTILFLALVWLVNISAQTLPEGFYDTPVAEGLDFPLGVTFDDLGRMYVWEKAGRVWVYDSLGNRAETPFIDISEEVADFDEHGLNYFLLDKNFLENGHCYLYYVLDRHHYYTFGTDDYDPDFSLTNDATIGRITKYTADPTVSLPKADPDSRNILLGEDLQDGVPILMISHGLGSLQQSEDGTILASCGDGASFLGIDIGSDSLESWISNALAYGIIEPHQDIGSYKSQYRGVLNGKILRLDPNTGNGLASNPFYLDGEPRHPSSRIWALGFRNPYRMVLKPLSGAHDPAEGDPGLIISGDVGGASWEEFNVIPRGGLNFGWPIFEGQRNNWGFNNAPDKANRLAPNPLYGVDGCTQQYFGIKELVRNNTPLGDNYRVNRCDNATRITEEDGFMFATPPLIFWNNRNWNPPTRAVIPWWNHDDSYLDRINIDDDRSPISGEVFTGESSLGGVFYTANNFPLAYQNTYYHMDYSGWIRIFDFDDANQLYRVRPFASELERPVHIALNPVDGNLYYVSLEEESVRQIGFGGNPPPVAVVAQQQYFGAGDLELTLDASSSYDPNDTPLSFHWDFGDGSTATTVSATHLFVAGNNAPRTYTVTLTVTDADGASDQQVILVSLDNSPPNVQITSFANGDRYPTDQTTLLNLAADVSDNEHDNQALTYEWQAFFHHNTHFHPEPAIETARGHTFIAPAGCGVEDYWYRIRLTVTDPEGLQTQVEQSIYPYCDEHPNDWASIQASPNQIDIPLDITTQLPADVDLLELQRSPDFFNFQAVTNFAPSQDQRYNYTDPEPILGTSYYRMRARLANGAFFYSPPTAVNFPVIQGYQITPNPARDFIKLSLENVITGTVQLDLFATSGQRLYRTEITGAIGEELTETIELGRLPAGVYLYQITNGDETASGKLLIQ